MDKRMMNIWIYAERKKDNINSVFYELLSKVKSITGDNKEAVVSAVILGNDLQPLVEHLSTSGVNNVYVCDDNRLEMYSCECYSAVLADAAAKYDPDVLLVGSTSRGADLAPATAGKLKTGLAAHCVNIQTYDSTHYAYCVPAFGGKIQSRILIPDARPQMATVRPGVFVQSPQEPLNAQVIELDHDILDRVERCEELLEFIYDDTSAGRIESAKIVICAGRGVSSEAAWNDLRKLADKLGAAIGYTRSFLDNGFVDEETNMVGVSGTTIRPDVYLGFGISGAGFHVSGINKSRFVCSVNTDSSAQIFEVSDVGAICDAGKMLSALNKELEK